MKEYRALVHAMQSGVAMKMNKDGGPESGETSPKHLRVGVNSAMCDHTALIRLLIKKGLFTEAEYFEEIMDEMEREVERYEKTLSEEYGISVRLV
jgi:hypothetical protein